MLVCGFLCTVCTRDRGCSAHPVFPAPSVWRVRKFLANLGRNASRECEVMSAVIARSICDEAIHLPCGPMDCFASARNDGRYSCLKFESEKLATLPSSPRTRGPITTVVKSCEDYYHIALIDGPRRM